MAIEEDAISLYAYECRAIPGLLQPEGYIRAIFERRLPPLSGEQIEHQVIARLERQQLLTKKPNTAFSFIIEQALLERRMGGPDVTRQLLDHLLDQRRRRNVEVQVMPLCQYDHAGIDGLMYLAETQQHERVGYSEGQQSSILITSPKDVSAMASCARRPSAAKPRGPAGADARSTMSTTEPAWFKSSYSGSSGDNSVEIAVCSEAVLVRDSKDTQGHVLTVSPRAWSAFAGRAAGSRVWKIAGAAAARGTLRRVGLGWPVRNSVGLEPSCTTKG
ncbi:DUF397 domain-containing protein [Streptomyces sp. NPDC060209]|uniref:DUF397 domain-containing protein n=1 Tax=Streptomyces sp. NPDC060209 TaxID=3347073 RepID=UPI0036650D1D